jgi:PAS domain S-box-containing protein
MSNTPEIGEADAEASALRASEARFNKVFHSSPAAMCITRLDDGKFIDFNQRFLDMYEYNREELLGLTTVTSGILRPDVRASVKQAASASSLLDRELNSYTRSGKTRMARVTVGAMDWDGERCLLTTVLDITANKRAEALSHGQSLVLEMIASDAPLALTLARLATVIEAQYEGMLCSMVLLDEDRQHMRFAAGPSLPDDYVKAMDGTAIGPRVCSCGTALYLGRPVIVSDILTDPLWESHRAVAEPHGFRACWSTPISSRQGKVLGTFAIYYREPRIPTHDENRLIGMAVHIAGIAIDRKRTEEALRQSQKMEAIGRLTGAIAHDFNNMLMVINGSCSEALRGLDPAHPLTHHLDRINQSGEKAATLTQRLLAYGRKQVLAPKVWNLNEIVTGMLDTFGPALGPSIRLITLLAAELDPVKADRGQVEQVIANLVSNARDAMRAGGTLTIETGNVSLDGRHGEPVEGEGPHVMLTMTDTGIGMAEETRARLFEPFFTTKPLGEGKGLGLSVVYGIVRQSGGIITVHSAPGKGSTFRIYFPSASSRAPLP